MVDVLGILFVLGFYCTFIYGAYLVIANITLSSRYDELSEHELQSRFSNLPPGPVVFGIRRIYVARPKLIALHLGEHQCTVLFVDGTELTLAGLGTGRWRLRSQVRLQQDAPRSLQLHYSLRNRWMKFGIDLVAASESVLPPWASSEQILLMEHGVFRSRSVSQRLPGFLSTDGPGSFSYKPAPTPGKTIGGAEGTLGNKKREWLKGMLGWAVLPVLWLSVRWVSNRFGDLAGFALFTGFLIGLAGLNFFTLLSDRSSGDGELS